MAKDQIEATFTQNIDDERKSIIKVENLTKIFKIGRFKKDLYMRLPT